MSGFEKLDIEKVTREAESGNGCAIKNAFEGLFYEQRLEALKLIKEQNRAHRQAGEDVPRLRAHDMMRGMDLHWDKSVLNWNRIIYGSSTRGTGKDYCQDLR